MKERDRRRRSCAHEQQTAGFLMQLPMALTIFTFSFVLSRRPARGIHHYGLERRTGNRFFLTAVSESSDSPSKDGLAD